MAAPTKKEWSSRGPRKPKGAETVKVVIRIAIVVSIAFASSRASAAIPMNDVSNASITCNTLFGTVSLKPGYLFGGSQPSTVKIKGTLDGCTVTGGSPSTPQFVTGTFKGTLAGAANDCFAFLSTNPLPGTITIRWKAHPSTPLMQKSSTLTISTLTGTLFAPGGLFGAAQYFQLSLGTTSVSGAFTGGDGGAASTNVAVTSEDFGPTSNSCETDGLKTLHLGLGRITLQ